MRHGSPNRNVAITRTLSRDPVRWFRIIVDPPKACKALAI
jgi:hypothetical protein